MSPVLTRSGPGFVVPWQNPGRCATGGRLGTPTRPLAEPPCPNRYHSSVAPPFGGRPRPNRVALAVTPRSPRGSGWTGNVGAPPRAAEHIGPTGLVSATSPRHRPGVSPKEARVTHNLARKRTALVALAASGAFLVNACSAPGTTTESTPQASTQSSASVQMTCGTDNITMKGYFETGFPLPKALTDEFTKQFPNVTWDVREDQFAVITQNALRVLADDPPDLMRLPSIQQAVKAGRPAQPGRVRHRLRLGQVAGFAAGAAAGQLRRCSWRGLALRPGPELQPDRRLLQQGPGRQDRHDRGPEDPGRAR